LELGGNAAMILTPSADRALALRAILFGAVGTTGQRCTSLRRLILHETLMNDFLPQLIETYQSLLIGDPAQDGVLVGPLVDANAFVTMQAALKHAQDQGGQVVYGGTRVTDGVPKGGFYVRPAIVYMPEQTDIVRTETFAPILYVMTYKNFADAVAMNNDVPQGLSSCIFTNHMREAELFCSSQGSDCGLAHVNMGPSGAEIGGAFGGDKETGGGRESGSDAWKNYMRRQTQVVNFSGTLPLAQGIRFGGAG
jgi:aldehyde dehydrogenase (NAD+)